MRPASIIAPPARRLSQLALEVVFPKRCAGCARFGAILCPTCDASVEPATGPGRCPNCAARWDAEGNCPRCFHWSALDGAIAAVEMEGVARRLVHELKYRHVRVAAPVMAHLMHGLPDLRPFDLALPIPLHRQRQRERGFNQAELLVRALGWPSAPALLRSRRTDQQVGKHLTERRRNVNGAFSYGGGPLTGMTVALVDDVVTTGATADECAKVLKDHGARRVVAVAFARASYDPKTGRADE